MKYTRQEYVKYLNRLSPPYDSDTWIIGGKYRRGLAASGKYGEALRKYDPIGFEVAFKEWARNTIF